MTESCLMEWEREQFDRFRPVQGLIVGLAPSEHCIARAPAFEEFGIHKETKLKCPLPCTARLRTEYGLPDDIYYGSVRVNALGSLKDYQDTEMYLPTNTTWTRPRAGEFHRRIFSGSMVHLAALGDHAKYSLIEWFDGRWQFGAVHAPTGFIKRENVKFFWAPHPSERFWGRPSRSKSDPDRSKLKALIRENMAAWAEGFSMPTMLMAAE